MDLTAFYEKIRAAAAEIAEPFPIVMSIATAAGGRDGTPIEVTRQVAAKMIVEGTAQIAKPAEARRFREQQTEARRLSRREA